MKSIPISMIRRFRAASLAAFATVASISASAQFTEVSEFVMSGTTEMLNKEAFTLTHGGDAGAAKYRSSLSVASHLDFTLLLTNADPQGRGSIGMIIGNTGATPSSPITGFLPPWPTNGGTIILLVSYEGGGPGAQRQLRQAFGDRARGWPDGARLSQLAHEMLSH
jgi:hypothetical protein